MPKNTENALAKIPVSAKRGRPPQTPLAEDKNDLAKDDRVFSTTSCGLN